MVFSIKFKTAFCQNVIQSNGSHICIPLNTIFTQFVDIIRCVTTCLQGCFCCNQINFRQTNHFRIVYINLSVSSRILLYLPTLVSLSVRISFFSDQFASDIVWT